MNIYDYTTSGGKDVISEYIKSLPNEEQAEIHNNIEAIQIYGMEAFKANMVISRQLQEKLWELKISKTRIMYVIKTSDSIYFLNICRKTKAYAERKEIKLALKRAKQNELL